MRSRLIRRPGLIARTAASSAEGLKLAVGGRLFCAVLLAASVAIGGASLGAQEPPASEPAGDAARAAKLEERDRLAASMQQRWRDGELDGALEAARKVLALEREIFGDVHGEVAGTLDYLARFHEELGSLDEARKCRRAALKINTALYGESDWRATDARLELEELERRARLGDEDRAQLARADNEERQAFEMWRTGRHGEAIALLQGVADTRERILGTGHRLYVRAVTLLGRQHLEVADFVRAEKRFRDALTVSEGLLGPVHPTCVTLLGNIGSVYLSRRDYAGAEPFLTRAFLGARRIGEETTAYDQALNNIAYLYYALGDYAKAEPLYMEAIALSRKRRPDSHGYSSLVGNLSLLYKAVGNYQRAAVLCQESLRVLKGLGDDAGYAQQLNNLANVYCDMDRLEDAEKAMKEALELNRKAVGEEHPQYARALNDLAVVERGLGRLDRAQALYEEALELIGIRHGKAHLSYATTLNNLGMLAFTRGDLERARSLIERSLETRRSVLGTEHPQTAELVGNLGSIHMHRGDYARARSLLRESLGVLRRSFYVASFHQSELQQILMLGRLRRMMDRYVSLAVSGRIPGDQAYGEILFWKGAVLSRQQLLGAERDEPELAPLFSALREVTGRAATLLFAVPPEEQLPDWRKEVARLGARREELERELAAKSSALRGVVHQVPSPDVLRDGLPEETVLIDFIEYAHTGRAEVGASEADSDPADAIIEREGRLAAFVVRPAAPIRLIDLGPARPIHAAITDWRRALGVAEKPAGEPEVADADSSSDSDSDSGTDETPPRSLDAIAAELGGVIWTPLREHAAGAKTLLISPDQALGRFPLGALPGAEPGTYLIEDFEIALAPVPQLLPEVLDRDSRPRDATRDRASLLAVGDVDYEADPSGGGAADVLLASSGTAGGSLDNQRRSAPRGEKFAAWPALEFTRTELLAVGAAFRDRHAKSDVLTLERDRATELAFREQVPGRRYIHVATHGFFAALDLTSATDSSRFDQEFAALASAGTGWHPGLLSGIVLSGANRRGPTVGDDGILTALELAQLDLREAELMVLSACETGDGPTAGGEGLLGLQRAAQVAGARSVVASLWKVDDRVTQAFMARFYENLWGPRRMTKLAALRETQLAFLRGDVSVTAGDADRGPGKGRRLAGGRRPYRASPRGWAAWVLSGDWR